jgi:carbohydrate kinase (thermoresistant glucokinase family)
MGVSGCGKSTIGVAVSKRCAMTFIDADDLHPKANIDKMRRGDPLTDADRTPWLKVVGETFAQTAGPVVIACSALKGAYRDIIRSQAGEPVSFIHLDASEEVLLARVTGREGHFMPPSLLKSQFAALEPLTDTELGTRIDIAPPLQSVIRQTELYVKETLT